MNKNGTKKWTAQPRFICFKYSKQMKMKFSIYKDCESFQPTKQMNEIQFKLFKSLNLFFLFFTFFSQTNFSIRNRTWSNDWVWTVITILFNIFCFFFYKTLNKILPNEEWTWEQKDEGKRAQLNKTKYEKDKWRVRQLYVFFKHWKIVFI